MEKQYLRTYCEYSEKIEVLGLSTRVYNMLKSVGYETISDVLTNYGRLFLIKNMGRKSYDEIRYAIFRKCNITFGCGDPSDLRRLNLSDDVVFYLVCNCRATSIDSVLRVPLHWLKKTGIADKIIEEVHSLGYKFRFEEEREEIKISLDTNIYETPIYRISHRIPCFTIGELLKMSLDPKDRKSLYGIRGLGEIKVKKIIDIVHSYGFMFDDEKNKVTEESVEVEEEIKDKRLTVDSSIYDLNYYKVLTSRINNYGVETIGDLLELSTNKNISYKERGIYNIRGLGEVRVKELINYLHSLGFVFKDEKVNLESNMSLDKLFKMIDVEVVSSEFYEKVNTLEEIKDNSFVIYFTKMAGSLCKNEYDVNYTNKEVLMFLINKLVEYKRNLFNISSAIDKQIKVKKYNNSKIKK